MSGLTNLLNREVAVMERSKEYDAFGPWIYEIDGEHEIPRLFRGCCDEAEKYLLLFKVPRNVERRKASPDMDLYEYLIGATDTQLHIFRKAGKRVAAESVDFKDIVAIKDVHALLKGELILYTRGEPVVIGYNTVSEDVILKLINIIESRISGGNRSVSMEGMPAKHDPGRPDSIDMLFVNLLGKLKESSPDINLVAFQPNMDIKRTRYIKEKLQLKACTPSKLAFLTNDRELIVILRELPGRKRSKEPLDYTYLYVPYRNIEWAQACIFDEQQSLSIMELGAGGRTFGFIFEYGNAGVADLCRKLSGMCAA